MNSIEKLWQILPEDVDQASLRALAPEDLWQNNPLWAAASVLALSQIFDATDYLDRYPDVAAAHMDPILHFVKFGLPEDRCFQLATRPGVRTLTQKIPPQEDESWTEPVILPPKKFDANRQDSLTVIIPAYNSERFLRRSVLSILAQTHENLEIIIYNDASNDNTKAIAEALAAEHPVIRLIHSDQNRGQGVGRNEAMKIARGQYVTFMDSDDFYSEYGYISDFLGKIISVGADAAVTPYLRKRKGVITKDNIVEPTSMTGAEAAQCFLDRKFGTHAPGAKIFKRELALTATFSPYGYSQDAPFVLSALLQSQKTLVSDLAAYVYENDNISCWRPTSLTPLHFYSSPRVLLEITLLAWEYRDKNLDLSEFIRIWREEHGQRIKKYMEIPENTNTVATILNWFSGFTDFLKFLLPNLHLVQIDNNSDVLTSNHEIYARELVRRLNNAVKDAPKESEKPVIVIWTGNLGDGGLERVAVHLGECLAANYQIVYLVEDRENTAYGVEGQIMQVDMFNLQILRILDQAKFIFDFHWKNAKDEFPFCRYMLANYAHKYVVTVHNTTSCESYFEVIKRYLGELGKERETLPAILCVSQSVRESFCMKYGDSSNLHVLHNPIDMSSINAAHPLQDHVPYILFCGRLNAVEHKGIDLLLNAWSESKLKNLYKLVLAGSGELPPEMSELIKSKHIEDSVEIVGFRKDIYSWMKSAAFLVAPSRWEGFLLTIAESLACGTPVLSANVGIAGEVVKEGVNGYLMEPGNQAQLLTGLNYMEKNAAQMRPNCSNSVASFALDNYYRNIQNFLDV